MTEDNPRLLPCPFCGAEEQPGAVGLRWEEEPDDLCHAACECCGGRTMGGDTEAEAITAWNTRAPSPAFEAMKEALIAAKSWIEADDMPMGQRKPGSIAACSQ